MPWTIRRAEPDDAEAAAEVWLSSRRDAVGRIPAPAHSDAEVRQWIAQIVVAGAGCWIVEAGDGAAVGLLVLDRGWIEQLYVAPGWQGRGIGGALVDHAKQQAGGPLQLWTFVSNDDARRFYKRHGFIAIERTDGAHNEEHVPDVRYRWTPR